MAPAYIQAMPAVYKIVTDAEQLISMITGQKAKLSIDLTPIALQENELVAILCERFKITYIDIASPSRKQEIVEVRSIFCWFMYHRYNYTYVKLAKMLNRDHTSIIHAVKTVSERLQVQDPITTETVKLIQSKLFEK